MTTMEVLGTWPNPKFWKIFPQLKTLHIDLHALNVKTSHIESLPQTLGKIIINNVSSKNIYRRNPDEINLHHY